MPLQDTEFAQQSDDAATLRTYSGLLDDALAYLKGQVKAYSEAEREYRKAKAREWTVMADSSFTAGHKQAEVDARTADLRYARDLHEGMKQAAIEAVRSRRSQVSAYQTLLNGHKAEADFARTGPDYQA